MGSTRAIIMVRAEVGPVLSMTALNSAVGKNKIHEAERSKRRENLGCAFSCETSQTAKVHQDKHHHCTIFNDQFETSSIPNLPLTNQQNLIVLQ